MTREQHLESAGNCLAFCKEKLFSDRDAKDALDELRHAVNHLLNIERERDGVAQHEPLTDEEYAGEISITCAKCERQAEQRMQIVRLPDRDHAAMALPPGWFFAHTPKGIGHVYLCSRECACWYLHVVCCPEACTEEDECDHTTRTAPESPCTCAEIQRKDPLRHFRECPLREDLPPGHPQATEAYGTKVAAYKAERDSLAAALDGERSRREALEREVRELVAAFGHQHDDDCTREWGDGSRRCEWQPPTIAWVGQQLRAILDRAAKDSEPRRGYVHIQPQDTLERYGLGDEPHTPDAEPNFLERLRNEAEHARKLLAVLTEIGHSNPAKAVWDVLRQEFP